MTPRNAYPFRRGIAVALLSCSALTPLAFPSVAHSGVPVIDTKNIAETAKQAQTGLNQLTELTQLKSLAQEQLATLGDFGPLGDIFGGSSFSDVGSSSDFYSNMEGFAFDPCAINLCTGGGDVVGTTDISEAREWVEKNFWASDVIEFEQHRDLQEIRRRGRIYAAINGVALATITSNDLAGAGEEASALEKIVEASSSLRGDLRANSAIALAAYKIELQQLAMLTSLLEVQAMETIAGTEVYYEGGSSSFADAFKEGDFAENDKTKRVRVTIPTKGSAGGIGFGGGLLGSIASGGSLSDLASSLGVDSGLSSVLGSGGGIDGLMSSVASGALPTLSPDALSMGTMISDSAALASSALPADVSKNLTSGLSMIETGMAKGGAEGRTSALLGASQALSEASGSTSLSTALNTGAMALDGDTPDMAIAFANGTLRDLRDNGVVGKTATFLEDQIAKVESGVLDRKTLVLDSSALLAKYGSDANVDVANILSVDPGLVDDTYIQRVLSDTIDAVATTTGVTEMSGIAANLRSVDEADLSSIRSAFEEASSSPASRSSGTGATETVGGDTGSVFR